MVVLLRDMVELLLPRLRYVLGERLNVEEVRRYFGCNNVLI